MGDDVEGTKAVVVRGERGGAPPWDIDKLPPDIAFAVALPEEFRAITALTGQWYSARNKTYAGYDYFWHDKRSGYRCVATYSGRMGPSTATHITNRLLEYRPEVVVNVGIAGSLHPDVRIGDVVVPDTVFAYTESGKAIDAKTQGASSPAEGWEWVRRGDAFRTSHRLVEEARHLATAHGEIHDSWSEAGGS